jgi:hypothetical protein
MNAAEVVPKHREPLARNLSPGPPGTSSQHFPLMQVRGIGGPWEPPRNQFRSQVVPGFPPKGGTGNQDQLGTPNRESRNPTD